MTLYSVFFSPTGTTKRAVQSVTNAIYKAQDQASGIEEIDITLPKGREPILSFDPEDIVVIGVPVYAGRVPNLLKPYLNTICGNGAKAICIVTYGNRHYDDALIELCDKMEENGFNILAAAAVIGQHSFSEVLAYGRPDDEDVFELVNFGERIGRAAKEASINNFSIKVPGNRPYRAYYKPLDKQEEPVDFRRIKPETLENCIDCKLCAHSCPMGSIDFENVHLIPGPCIKCCACVHVCPVSAKVFSDKNFIDHKIELEEKFTLRRSIETFCAF